MVAVVLLRLAIGWHFFQEGAKKLRDPKFTSAHFFRQAKGPLAEFYKNKIPDNFGHARLDPATLEGRLEGWEDFRAAVSQHYEFDEEQEAESLAILKLRSTQLKDFFAEKGDDLRTYFHELERLEEWKKLPSSKRTPHESRWMAKKETELQGQALGWTKNVDLMSAGLVADLNALADESQFARGPKTLGDPNAMPIDRVVTWLTFLVGVGLLLGLCVRPAAVAGMLFLFSVMATQPPWVAGAEPIYNQLVEFLALFVLAAVGAGRWGGLDFLVGLACQRWCGGCCQGKCAA